MEGTKGDVKSKRGTDAMRRASKWGKGQWEDIDVEECMQVWKGEFLYRIFPMCLPKHHRDPD